MFNNRAKSILQKNNQSHVLKYFEELTKEEQNALLAQVKDVDFSIFDTVNHTEPDDGVITPSKAFTLDTIKENEMTYRSVGISALQRGELALVMLAGGQGTRLGFDGPKGTYNIGKTRDLYIFQCLINNIMDVVNITGKYIHLYIMTSDKNHDDTVAFFEKHNFFGYKKRYTHFFVQEMLPSIDFEGKLLMESKSKLTLSPNGNGGWFSSMEKAGCVEELKKYGVKYINVFAVDNVLQRIADPVFFGAMLAEDYCSAGKVVRKANPDERVGVICNRNGKPHIVEYYELTPEMRDQKDENGDYAYNFGVILNYIFPVSKLMTLLNENMPIHAAKKAIEHIDDEGNHVKPKEPNGYKFETLALDMLKFMDDCLAYEVVREYEFAPIKNGSGVDSPETARSLLEKNGVTL